jgi:catechol 2,3-dioxygenase-like lactoylglutathione lyase family enzyme
MNSNNKVVFVLMPFHPPFDDVYNSIVRPAVEGAKLVCRRADELTGPGIIIDEIVEQIREARFLIADFSEPNFNVSYEIGVAHAFNKTVILMSDKATPIPFDIGAIRCIRYENSGFGLPRLLTTLSDAVKIAKDTSNDAFDLSPQQFAPDRPNGIQHMSIVAGNWRVSAKFYRDVIGLKLMARPDYHFEGAWFILGNGQHLHIVQEHNPDVTQVTLQDGRTVPSQPPLPTHFAFSVEDPSVVHARLVASNIEIVGELCPDLRISQFYFHDLDGNLIEINDGLGKETKQLLKGGKIPKLD